MHSQHSGLTQPYNIQLQLLWPFKILYFTTLVYPVLELLGVVCYIWSDIRCMEVWT